MSIKSPSEPIFMTDWFTDNIPQWESLLAPYKGQKDLSFLEVGSFEGRSTLWLLENVLTHPSSRITCVDRFDPAMVVPAENTLAQKESTVNLWENFHRNTQFYQSQIIVERGRSQEVLRKLPMYTYDFAYIDASHSAVDTLEDTVLAFRLLRPGGLLIWDDYRLWEIFKLPENSLEHPKLGIDAFLKIYAEKIECIHQGYQIAIRKITL